MGLKWILAAKQSLDVEVMDGENELVGETEHPGAVDNEVWSLLNCWIHVAL